MAPRPGAWNEAHLDLSPLAGALVRLDLSVTGGSNSLGAAWAGLQLKVPAKPLQPPLVTPSNKARDLILVVVDAARRDAFRAFNPRTSTHTPAVSALAREGVVFTDAQANASHTVASVSSMITGRYPHTLLGVGRNTAIGPDIPTLSGHLRQNGFACALLTANPYLSPPFGFHRDQDLYRAYLATGPGKGTRRIFDEGLAWAREQRRRGRRFFLQIQTMDPHHPYRYHASHTPRYLGQDRADATELRSLTMGGPRASARQRRLVRALYHGEIDAHDVELARFLSGLRRQRLLDRALVVFTADHGEELYEHGNNEHGQTLYEEVLAVPLVMRLPGLVPAGGRVRHPVELVDLLPTVLQLLNLPALGGVHGRSLFPLMHGHTPREPDYILAESRSLSVRLGPFKLIKNDIEQLLFDLRSDPTERNNIITARATVARALEVRLGEALAVPHKQKRLTGLGRPRAPAVVMPTLTPALKRQLESLGYIQ